MSMHTIGAQIDADNARLAIHETFGHMGADAGRYEGVVLFAVGEFSSGEAIVIETKFEGEIDCGPWFYMAVNDFVNKGDRAPGVYRAAAAYTMYKNGVNKVTGKVKKLKLPA